MYHSAQNDLTGASDRQYRRGAIMGLTMAEIILLITFALLLLLGAWNAQTLLERERLASVSGLSDEKLLTVRKLDRAGQLEPVAKLVAAGLDLRSPEGLSDPEKRWRLIDRDELISFVP